MANQTLSIPSTEYTYSEQVYKNIWNFIDTLVKNGLAHVIASPGSRSTPLYKVIDDYANLHSAKLEVSSYIREASASHIGLGTLIGYIYQNMEEKFVALVCTSGTAATEYASAVAEAKAQGLRLLVITADRPPEWQYLGAAQTMDQLKIYSGVSFLQMPVIDGQDATEEAIKNIALVAIQDLRKNEPVHINFPFREPLVPKPLAPELLTQSPEVNVLLQKETTLSSKSWNLVKDLIQGSKKPLIMSGPQNGDMYAVNEFIKNTGIVSLSHPLSNVSFISSNVVLAELAEHSKFLPDLIIYFGNAPTSRNTGKFINSAAKKGAKVLMVNTLVTNSVLTRNVINIPIKPNQFFDMLNEQKVTPNFAKGWNSLWEETLENIWNVINNSIDLNDEISEARVAARILKSIKEKSVVMASNSTPIRYLENYTHQREIPKEVIFTCRRGLNGIEGNISQFYGSVKQLGLPGYLFIGDVSFIHDLASLEAMAFDNTNSINIILIDNAGGRIFDSLPQGQATSSFTPQQYNKYYTTKPNVVSFANICNGFGIGYEEVTSWEQLNKLIEKPKAGVRVLRIVTNPERTAQLISDTKVAVIDELKRLLDN